MIKLYFHSLLGYHHIGEIIDPDAVRHDAVLFTPKCLKYWWLYLPAKPAIYVFENHGQNYYLCRTFIGFLFPSLFRLSLSQPPRLIPHPIRFGFGYALIFFVIVSGIVTSVLSVTMFPLGLLSIGFWLLTLLIFWLGTSVEKALAVRGYINL